MTVGMLYVLSDFVEGNNANVYQEDGVALMSLAGPRAFRASLYDMLWHRIDKVVLSSAPRSSAEIFVTVPRTMRALMPQLRQGSSQYPPS